MYPEDRVLVGVMPHPRDFEIAQEQHWYRVPVRHAPEGIHAEYVAFYFTKPFGPDLRWAIHYYARRTGHELVRRIDLLPDQPDHPRAQEHYYKLQLGTLKHKQPPIVSLRWRRITFIHTTWERFAAAREINDLFGAGGLPGVEPVYRALKTQGIQPERAVTLQVGQRSYTIDLLIPCCRGAVMVSAQPEHPPQAIVLQGDETQDLPAVLAAIERQGGPAVLPER